MRIILKREIPIEEYIVYAELEINQDRTDIQDYLESSLGENDNFNKKIQQYLQQVDILDRQNNLTQKGKKVLKNGKFPAAESGKYHISITKEDVLVGNYVLALKRMGHKDNQRLHNTRLKNIRNKTFKSKIAKGTESRSQTTDVRIRNLGRKDQVQGLALKSNHSTYLEWNIQEEKQELQLTNKNDKFPKKIELNPPKEQPNQIMRKLFGERWDEKNEALRIKVDKGGNEKKETLQDFLYKRKELNVYDTNFGEFSEVRGENIPLIPDGKTSAENWMMQLLQYEFRSNYLLPKKYEFLAESIKNKERLKPFSLKSIPMEELLENSLKTNSGSYWNLAAPLDLDPFVTSSKKKKNKEDVFHIQPLEQISFMDIANRIMPATEIKAFIYVDRYIKNNLQQQSFEVLVESVQKVKGEFPVLVYTKKQSRNAYQTLGLANIRIFDFDTTGYLDHDRYFIFQTQNDEWVIWKSTRSLDYLQFPKDAIIDIDVPGRSKDGVTFVRVEKELLTQELKIDIQNQLQTLNT